MSLSNFYLENVISKRHFSWLKESLIVITGSLLLAICAPISVKLPFTPIPLAVAPHLCLVLGVVLGSKRGSLVVVTYLLQGIFGLPVFALGASGLLHLCGPRGGYLVGYVFAAYATGRLMEIKRGKSDYHILLSLIIGNVIIYLFGIFQLSFFIGYKSAILLGLFPFLIGDGLKLILLYKGIKRYLNFSFANK